MRPPVLTAYLALSARAARWGQRLLQKRLAKGKEDPDRLQERMGRAQIPRPDGRLIWFHAASVGESLSLLEVIRRLEQHDKTLTFLITTGTVTSADLLTARLSGRCLHQFVPLDVMPYVTQFLDHWRPDLAVWTENELWPNLILETAARGTPMVLVNARMSERSFKRWKSLGGAAAELLSAFAAIQIQDDLTAGHLRQLGLEPSRMAVTGTLKEGTPPPQCDEAELSRLTNDLAGRPVWLASSTHEGEDLIALAAHDQVRTQFVGALLILAPRHPHRADAIETLIRDAGMTVRRRSRGELADATCDVYLADTMGEMGLWYRLAPVSFVGGSLAKVGGHNPFEPAALGSAIIHGPEVSNFQDIYARLDTAGAAIPVTTSAELAEAVNTLMQPSISAPMAYAAWELASSGAVVTDKALALILDHLPEHAP